MRPQELVMVTPKSCSRQEDALCVMAQCAVPEVGDDFLAAVDYVDSHWRVLLLQGFGSIRAR